MKNQQKNKQPMDAPIEDAGTVSASSNDSRKASIQDIQLVQNLIERCLIFYMNKNEVVETLLTKARIQPEFTSIVWQKLEEENKEFFRAYYIRLALKKQITVFNKLLEHQYHLMKNFPPKIPLVPLQNGVPVMGYPVLQHPQMHVPGHPHVAKGVPEPSNSQPLNLRLNSTNDMVIDTTVDDATTPKVIDTTVDDATTLKVILPSSSGGISEMAVSPASVASDMVMNPSVVDSDVGEGGGGGAGNSRDSFDQLDWNLNLSDLNIEHLSDLGSPFLPSDSQLQEDMDKFLGDVPSGSDMFLDLDKLLAEVPEPSDEDKP